MIKRTFFFSILLLVFSSSTSEINLEKDKRIRPPFLAEADTAWVESVFATLSLEEKVAQLLMVAAYSNKDAAHIAFCEKVVRDHKVGGLIFFQGGPVRQARLTNRYQNLAKVPLLIAQDAEWGIGMRLDSVMDFPRQLTLGAIQNNDLLHEMGIAVGKQCNRLGVHINLAPVVDINNNPNNPVINDRSFGEDKYNVAVKGAAYMKGLQDKNVIACAKHFPGHGDTDKDSHKTLPVISHTRSRLDSLELYPFKEMIKLGLSSIMSAHLFIPAIDNAPNTATSVSEKAIKELLREEMGFEGLIITDALNMKGVSNFYEPGALDLKALLADNDILLMPDDVPKAIAMITQAVKDGKVSQETIDEKVRKILKAKKWVGLDKYKPIQISGVTAAINTYEDKALKTKLIRNALTLLKNDDNLIPLKLLDTLSIASLSIGAGPNNSFQTTLSKYANVKHHNISRKVSTAEFDKMFNNLKDQELVIVGLHSMSRYASKDYYISSEMKAFLKKLNDKTTVILTVFGSPYSVKYFEDIKCLIVAYEDGPINHSQAAQLIFGGIPAAGRLPVTASKSYKYGQGLFTSAPVRLRYTVPEDVGIRTERLWEIDSIAMKAIRAKATPGCQILVAKNGAVIYNKSFGHHTYANSDSVKVNDLYDLASITKVASTLTGLMRLYDLGQLKLRKPLDNYLPDLDETNKGKLLIRDILLHQSGLRDWIPFYMKTLNPDKSLSSHYSRDPDEVYGSQVANGMYIQTSYRDSIWNQIVESKLYSRKKYVYSDLGFYIFHRILEEVNRQPLQEYMEENFYAPLGMSNTSYQPLTKYGASRIVPTEDDDYFRHQLLRGHVHDMGAAMMGGVAGHAGLFTNTNDLAILFQMFLNEGEYGGERFIKAKTIKKFTKQADKNNRRGLGFDKPEGDSRKIGPTADGIPLSTFGHSGFTGTCVWADPENNLIYIFLSNRVHPSMKNNKLVKMNIRTDIQSAIYAAIEKGMEDMPVVQSENVADSSSINTKQ